MAMLMIADSPDGDVYDSCLSDSPMRVCVMSKQLIRSKRPQWCYINPAQAALKMLNIGNIAGKLTVDTQAFCSMNQRSSLVLYTGFSDEQMQAIECSPYFIFFQLIGLFFLFQFFLEFDWSVLVFPWV